MNETKRKREQARRQRIVTAAERLFYERGIAGTSMDDVAAAVPVSKMTLYKYAGSKETLLDFVLTDMLERGLRDFEAILTQSASPMDALKGLAEYRGMDDVTGVFVQDLARLYPDKAKALIHSQQQAAAPLFEKLIFEGQQRGQIRKDLSPHVVLLFVMGLKDFVTRAEGLGGPLDLRTISEQLLSILYYGIVVPDEV